MKLISFLLLFFMVENHNARQNPSPNVIRIPLRTIHPKRQATSSNTVRIFLDDNLEIAVGNLSIGNPPQNFSIKFDTGSDNLWVYSSNYDTCDPNWETVRAKHKLYHHENSAWYKPVTSYRDNPKAELVEYVTGYVFGYRAIDQIGLAGKKINGEFLEITKTTDLRPGFIYDGLMGLQYRGKGNIVSNLCKKIKGENKFSFYLPRHKWEGKTNKGELVLCGEDTSKYKINTMKYVKETNPGSWQIAINSITMQTAEGTIQIASGVRASVDSGSPRIVAQESVMKKFFDIVKPILHYNNWWKLDCSRNHLLPNLTFHIAGTKYTLTGRDYSRNRGNACYLAVRTVPSDHWLTGWILGEPFLRKYYTVFDIKNHRIGIAVSKG